MKLLKNSTPKNLNQSDAFSVKSRVSRGKSSQVAVRNADLFNKK